jgi:dihydrofolate reductase
VGRLVVSEFVTLDGVMEDPGGAEGFEHGGWAFQFDRGKEGDAFKLEETLGASALLLGRRTYEGFAQAWPGRTDEQGFAEKMNSMPKYVVSSTLEAPSWNNSTVLEGNLPAAVSGLKEEQDGDILVAGSGQLVGALLANQLVDELRLMVFPLALGAGKRLFPDGVGPLKMELREAGKVGAGVLVLRYQRAES